MPKTLEEAYLQTFGDPSLSKDEIIFHGLKIVEIGQNLNGYYARLSNGKIVEGLNAETLVKLKETFSPSAELNIPEGIRELMEEYQEVVTKQQELLVLAEATRRMEEQAKLEAIREYNKKLNIDNIQSMYSRGAKMVEADRLFAKDFEVALVYTNNIDATIHRLERAAKKKGILVTEVVDDEIRGNLYIGDQIVNIYDIQADPKMSRGYLPEYVAVVKEHVPEPNAVSGPKQTYSYNPPSMPLPDVVWAPLNTGVKPRASEFAKEYANAVNVPVELTGKPDTTKASTDRILDSLPEDVAKMIGDW